MTAFTFPVVQHEPVESFKAGGASSRGSHRLAEIRHCKRKWFFRWLWKLVTKFEPSYRKQGSLIHLLLAYHYAAKMQNPPEWLTKRPLMQALSEEATGYPDDLQLAKEVFQAYRAKSMDQGGIPMSIEQEFFATIGQLTQQIDPSYVIGTLPGDNELVSARIDLMQLRNGKLFDIDYKSTLRGSGLYLNKFNPNGEWMIPWQFMVQTLILRQNFGDQFGGVIVQRIKRKSPFDMDEQFIPMPQRPFKEMPNALRERTLAERELIEEYVAAQKRGEDMEVWMPQGDFSYCFNYGKPCDYRALCLADSKAEMQLAIQMEFDKLP